MVMGRSQRKSVLCPNCRRIVSADERLCPHCGIARPGSPWKNNPVSLGLSDGPQMIKLIIYANVALFLVSLAISGGMFGPGFNPFRMFSPTTRGLVALGATGTLLVRDVGWWTLVSANYLHGSILHIFFNMMALYQIAPLITKLYGTHRFFTIFTFSGVGGFLVSYLMGIPITVGASAALCGLIGAALFYGKNRGGLFGQAIYKQVGVWALFILVSGFMIPQVNNSAHIGGMAVGALVAAILGYNERSPERMLHRNLAAACIVVTVLVLLWALVRGLLYLFAA
jgi:rhomboid protease GluP